ncbi:hypothetical protein LCGC14_0017790 [marine sediment metagenome]|uniref:DUF1571 domain-containing protein n=1 Tax=marine sediment metagenome TaxID=412755 RepID=A0A0F9Z2H8_9ZZZZ|nr:DUF1571 domain-containing protein [Phycisphaerae bacterium]HDZ43291.1 DUF1571 domain-containing protein [Phycisphaerae bacterium]
MLKRFFGPTTRRTRMLVGLLLASLFFVLYTTQAGHANRPGEDFATVVHGRPVGKTSESALEKIEKLAKTDQIALLELCLANYRNHYTDFTCTFIKQERINGKMLPKQVVDVAVRQQPHSVAMSWRTVDEDGNALKMPRADRALYVEGMWDNQMLVRPTSGLLQALTGGVVLRKPTDPDVLEATLRPISSFGLDRSLANLLDVYRQAKDAGDLTAQFAGYVKVGDRDAIVLKRLLPAKKDYLAATTIIYIDLQYLVPIMIEGYDWNDQKFCTYLFKDIQFNLDLPPERFTPKAIDMNNP